MSSGRNVKVHYAGCDNDQRALAVLKSCGVRYRLFTSYPFIKGTDSHGDFRVADLAEARMGWEHVIVDSGLFTMMFGSDRSTPKTPEFVREWMHRICAFADQNDIPRASFVECDCQRLISPEFAWELRREMRELMPGREIINVLHLPDGRDGFERLVEFSDYIAISVPELRMCQPKGYRRTVAALARQARRMKPGIKIHLLGCTEERLLRDNRFCTTADSSSWTAPVRFGELDGRHISRIDPQRAMEARRAVLGTAHRLRLKVPPKLEAGERKACTYTAGNYYSVKKCQRDYTAWCGPQD